MRPFPILTLLLVSSLRAAVGDPQLATDHPWYPGKLAISSFERLAITQAAQYQRTTGNQADTDHHKALAAWFFRNTQSAHGEEGKENLWDNGFANDSQHTTRDYWTGLFAHGFGLCGTTHAQWTAELDALLGPCRSRVTGTHGHNSFEVFLKGGGYGDGRWAMLDHDLSTVIFDAMGTSLLELSTIAQHHERFARRDYHPERQKGWLICALHKDDGASYAAAQVASNNPPSPDIAYHIDYSLDGGQKWSPMLKDGRIHHRGTEPKVFWSQSMWSTALDTPQNTASTVRVRFHNTGGKRYFIAEGHLLYPVVGTTSKVTFAWTGSTGEHQQTKLLDHRESWQIPTRTAVKTRWVEIAHP